MEKYRITHILKCTKLNSPGNEYDNDKILNGFISEIKGHLTIWRENIEEFFAITSGTSRDTVVPVRGALGIPS